MPNLASTVFASLLLGSSVQVDVGKFDPADFPNLIKLERRLPHAEMTQRVEKIMAGGQCRIPGQSKLRFDITVRFAVLMENGGKARRIVVGTMDCQPLELLVGQVIAAQAARGDFPVRHEGEQWYVSDLNFSLGEPITALVAGQEEKMICKRSEAQLGTRLKFTKMCKTAAEWKTYAADRQQMRRDISNSGMCGGNASCSGD